MRKQPIGEEIRRRLEKAGASTQPEMVQLLRKNGVKISQPTLSRLLRGRYDGQPSSLIEVCKYAGIPMNKYLTISEPKKSRKLIEALRWAWDGTKEQEVFLARVIKAAAKLHGQAMQRTRT